MAELHINVGLVALSRGFLSLEAFAQGMGNLASGGSMSIRELWVRPGRLNEDQLAVVMQTVEPNRDTMLYSVDLAPVEAGAAVDRVASRAGGLDDDLRAGHTIPGPPDPRAELRMIDPVTTPVRGQGSGNQNMSPPATAPTDASLVPPIPSRTVTPVAAPRGELIGSRYRKLGILGVGGLGEVTACEDQVLGRTIALKAGHAKSELDAYSQKVILLREAKIISHLEHPNIIPIYDAGSDADRGPFYVMRQVTDTSLEMILRRRRLGEGDPHQHTLNRLLRYFLQVCNAVDYAHHRGVIHCDIKPANILLGDYGEVLLVDWGLAQSHAHPLGVRGGTLGYMAPEQMDATIERFDACTDVFALGAILYEILAGKSAFPEVKRSTITTLSKDPAAMYSMPLPPSEVATDPEIVGALRAMPEIEELCMKALAVDRKLRLQTARELADAIDEFIEGSKQKEREKIEADRNADAGDELAERYHEFVEARADKLSVVRSLRADVAPWAPTEDKQDLWDSEDIIRVTDALQVRTFQSAVSTYERALDSVPNHVRARRGLARLYASELRLARRRGDVLHEIANEQLLREVDDGEFRRELEKYGTLHVTIPAGARVTLSKLVEQDRRLVESSMESLDAGEQDRTLAAGRYVVTATFDENHRPVAWPVNIEPGATCSVAIALGATYALAPGEVVIPGGPARLGGDPLASDPEEPYVVDVPGFVIQQYPVTLAQWREFVASLDPAERAAHEPRMEIGLGASAMPEERTPVFGISAESAEAYARWIAAKTGRPWRLPTEVEWEKAARGTDGRVLPWGDHFDATFCKMRDSRVGQPSAEPIGAFASDVSPYGVCDLAGGVADWCTPDPRRLAPREPREVVSRGGAWRDWAIDCRLASRRRHLVDERSARVGFRLARDL